MFEENYPESLKRLFIIKGEFGPGVPLAPLAADPTLTPLSSPSPQDLPRGLQPGQAPPERGHPQEGRGAGM